MRSYRFTLFTLGILFLCLASNPLNAQDIEGLFSKLKEKFTALAQPPKLTGGINANAGYNYITGIPRRTNPFTTNVAVNLNLSVAGLNIPFSTILSNKQLVYNFDPQLPPLELPSYNFTGLSPTYKWATVHLGDRSMSFSPYTLDGHSFKGYGVELKPNKFYFGAMYGRLRRAVAEDFRSRQALDPSFRRMAWSFKAGYDTGEESIALIMFKGWDDPNSIPPLEQTPNLTPAENTVVSLIGKKKFGKIITLSVDYAISALNRDANSPTIEAPNLRGFVKGMAGLFNPRITAGYYNALKSSLEFKTTVGDFSANHEWVDPGYRTLGALFFNNDYENWTIGSKNELFKKKLILATDIGVQRNNLNKIELNTAAKFIGSINATITPSENSNLNISYSNFRNTNKLRANTIPFIQVDSLILSQVNQNANIVYSHLGGEEKNRVFSAMVSYQAANSIENDEVQEDQNTANLMTNLTYTHTFTTSKLILTGALLANRSAVPNVNIWSLSPTLSVGKPFFEEQLKLTSSLSYVAIAQNGDFNNNVFTFQTAIQYTLLEKHQFSLNTALINRSVQSAINGIEAFTEFTGGMTYAWSF